MNAKYHEQEAEIVAQAGKLGAVTIATNMAGRGTDITLGGNAEFMAKEELKKAGYAEEIINEAIGHAETDHAEILEARGKFNEFYQKFKAETDADAEKVPRRPVYPRHRAPRVPASITSCAAVQAVRVTPVSLRSISPWRTTSCVCLARSAFRA